MTIPLPAVVANLLGWLDSLLGRVTMYRLVTSVLVVLAGISLALAFADVLDPTLFGPAQMVASLAVLLVTSVGSNLVLGLIWRRRPHSESAVITALLLWFLYWPADEPARLLWLGAVAVAANLSKYVLAFRGRHLFNPAAAGVVIIILVQEVARIAPENRLYTTWWVASEPLFWFVLAGAVLVLARTRRLSTGAVFVLVASVLLIYAGTALGSPTGDAVRLVAYSSPVIFLAGFMLSEPLTLPPRTWQRGVIAAVAAVVYSWPIFCVAAFGRPAELWIFGSTQELALLVANVFAFALAPRVGIKLTYAGSRPLGGDAHELSFTSARPLAFTPGQYVELHLPHHRPDGRGVRRIFSLASAPSASASSGPLQLGIRIPAEASSFKQSLSTLEPGAMVHATGVWGDFVLPRDPARPVLLVAGGIGVTPYLSMLRDAIPNDAVIVYGVGEGPVPYRDELAATEVPVILVSPTAPDVLPDGWSHVASPLLSPEVVSGPVAALVPGLESRVAYVSGPPVMVDAVAGALRGHVSRIRTDHFSGY